jgi:predicted dehydrogenase
VLTFKNSAVGQYIEDHAGHGQGLWQRVIYGSNGSLNLPSDRSGKPVVAILDDKGTINNERILELIPDYHLEDMTAKLFGGERIWHYDFPFSEIDGKLLAVEYYDFAESILKGRSPGVNSYQAERSVGLTYAMLESAKLGRSVTMDEIMSEKVTTYQDEINDIIGL